MKKMAKKVVQSQRSGQPHQVRIIGGAWKRTPLAVLDAEGLRPTPDRVRETLFNWIDHLTGGVWSGLECLDLFAGSGALGFEAASRGAASVTLVEAQAPLIRQLEAVKARLQAESVRLIRADALATARTLAAREQRFGLIFLDPPYQADLLPRALPLCQPLLQEGGLVYVESDFPFKPDRVPEKGLLPATEWLEGWEVLRQGRAGAVYYHLLRRHG